MNLNKHLVLIVAASFIGGCSWMGFERTERYLQAESISRVNIPEHLDRPNFTDVMGVPQVSDPRGLGGKKLEIGLPEALSTNVDVDKIVIKKLGDNRWVFLDMPPATVWPRVRQFFEANNLVLDIIDPSRGILETKWLNSREGDAEQVFKYLKQGISWTDAGETIQNKFRLRIEPGIRSDSSEIYLVHKEMPRGAPYRTDSVDWDSKSDNDAVEEKVLTELAHYLGETINQRQSVSLLAGNLRENRAELIPGEQRPVLKYKLSFDRAWATVGAALANARIDVEDLDRTSAIYYVVYDDSMVDKPGFLSRLFSRGEEKVAVRDADRYLVHLDILPGEEVHVTVKKNQETHADALVAERLLKIIKEYST